MTQLALDFFGSLIRAALRRWSRVLWRRERVTRNVRGACDHPSCTRPALEDHNKCERHRDLHRARQRRWWGVQR